MKRTMAALATFLCLSTPVGAERIGVVETNGWFFKDTVIIQAVDDPDYPGVTCYVTSVDRTLNWDNASDSSIACRLVGEKPTVVPSPREDIFTSSTGLFKYQKVDRFYDSNRDVLVYISYVRKLEGKNFAHSISVVPLSVKR